MRYHDLFFSKTGTCSDSMHMVLSSEGTMIQAAEFNIIDVHGLLGDQ